MTQDRGSHAIAFSIPSNGLATSAKVQSSEVGAQARQAALATRTPPCRARPIPWPSGRHDHRLALDLRQAVFAGALACNFIRRRDVVLRIVVDAGIADTGCAHCHEADTGADARLARFLASLLLANSNTPSTPPPRPVLIEVLFRAGLGDDVLVVKNRVSLGQNTSVAVQAFSFQTIFVCAGHGINMA